MKKKKSSAQSERYFGQRVITSRARMTHLQMIHRGLRSPKQDRQPTRTSTNLLAKERGKSRQRHKDVNAALFSVREPACDPEPNAFDYINYSESDGASGSDLTAIHNKHCLWASDHAQVTCRTTLGSSEKTCRNNKTPERKQCGHILPLLFLYQQTHTCMHMHMQLIMKYCMHETPAMNAWMQEKYRFRGMNQ